MSDCCTDGTFDLGCIGFCDTIETGVTAPATDTYIISIIGAGGFLEVSGTIGAEITFTNVFNEDSITIFQILRDGTPQERSGKDCFQIKVNPGISLL